MIAFWIGRALAFAGFVDAAYLTATHYAGGALVCGPGGGCDIVTTSRYSAIGPVPIAAIGLVYYVVVNFLVWSSPQTWNRRSATALLGLTGAAVVVSALLVYLQAAVIGAWCRYCLVSAAVSALLFVTALALRRRSDAWIP